MAGVRFRRAGRIYYFDASRVPDLDVDDMVIVDTVRGMEMGRVALAPGQILKAPASELKPIVRLATDADRTRSERLNGELDDVIARSRALIAKHGLPMKAVFAEQSFDGQRLTVYFVSEQGRVDFRSLVRDMARSFRKRVLLRQIGPRDHAKLLGGIDRCGLELCCSTWMPEFQPISVRMAKTQQLPLNPSEISGVCGKLLCCLAFEDDQYRELSTGLPKVGARLTSAVGRGRVVDVNVLSRKITIAWETGSRVVVDAEEFAEQKQRKERAFGEADPPASPPSH